MNYSTPKTKILAVAPYPGLHDIIYQIGTARDDISLTVLDGDYEEGLHVVQEELLHNEYDLLISRGGTAEILKERTSLPVFEIEITASDILHAIKLADAYKGKSALVGFSSTTKHAKIICQLLNNDMPIYTIHHPTEADTILKELHEQGYTLVICDTIVSLKAVDVGLTPVLITSSKESIEKVFDQTSILGNTLYRSKKEKNILIELLGCSTSDLAVFTGNGTLLHTTPLDEDASSFLNEIITNKAYDFTGGQPHDFTRQLEHKYITVTITASREYEDIFCASIRHTQLPNISRENFVKVFSSNSEIAQKFFFQPNIVETYFHQYPLEDTLLKSQLPVIVLGETGTFYDSVVSYLYEQSTQNHTSLTVIDLKDCKTANLNWLMNHVNSPLFNNRSSLYFKNISFLSASARTDLIAFLEQGEICKQNKVYFSIDTNSYATENQDAVAAITHTLLDSLSAKVLKISPLRECPDIISNLTIICINQFNMRYNKQIIGIAPNGIEELTEYDWPDNFKQFYRLMKTLVQTTNEVLIPLEEIKKAVASEKDVYHSVGSVKQEVPFDLHQPLNKIMHHVVKQVVANENGNQKKAAEVLEISRTTIWRILKEDS